jgi:hypothetical protein
MLVALEDVEAQHPLSPKIAVAQAKRYLGDTNALIRLYDLIERETSQVHSALASTRFSLDIAYSGTEYQKRVSEYERCLHVLGPVLGCTAHWGNASHGLAVRRSLERIANGTVTQPRGTVLDDLRLYPATLLLYSVGVVAVAAERQTNLAPLLTLSVRDWNDRKDAPACVALIPSTVLRGGTIPPSSSISSKVHDAVRPMLHEVLPDDRSYTEAFDWFEYILALCSFAKDQDSPYIGSFATRDRDRVLRLAAEDNVTPQITDAIQSGCLPNPWTALRDSYLSAISKKA